jgi:hypothetical protein
MAGGTRWNPRNPPRTGNGAVPSRRAKPLASTQNAPAVTTRGIVRHADGNGREPKPLCTAPPSPTESRIPKYRSVVLTHNGIGQWAGPIALCVRQIVWHPHPRQDVAAIVADCTAPHPPTPRPYGLLPNISESSGTPGESPGFSLSDNRIFKLSS